jgi:capsular exopolysaccharide synthesis family protein
VVLVIAFIAMGFAGAFAYVKLAPKTYQAEADLLVMPVAADDPNLIGLPLIRQTADPTSDVLTASKLVTAPDVASRVSAQLGGSPNSLLANVSATPVTQSDIVAVQATASTATHAAALANAFAQQTVTSRTHLLHAQLARLIPQLKASMRGLTAADAAALSSELAEFETLSRAPDPTLRVSSPATPPTSPASPKKTLSLAAGGFAGLVLGVLTVLALQAVDPKLRDEEQLRELYDLPLLARIPRQRAGRTPITPDDLSPAATEAFRTLRSAFSLRHGSGDRGHAVLITGDSAGAGKTTVALNLAASLSASGKHVILIEADMRRPSIGHALRVTAPQGLASVLFDEIDLVDALITTRWHGPQLELLLAGSGSAGRVDRISPERARELVREACEICDFVVIDSPPLTDITDALPLAEEADDVLLVARIGTSQLRKLSDLGELLIRERIRPAGVALVGPPEKDRGYYYRYRSGAPALWGLLQKRNHEPSFGDAGAEVAAAVNGAGARNGAGGNGEVHLVEGTPRSGGVRVIARSQADPAGGSAVLPADPAGENAGSPADPAGGSAGLPADPAGGSAGSPADPASGNAGSPASQNGTSDH